MGSLRAEDTRQRAPPALPMFIMVTPSHFGETISPPATR
jgi:hypothetical protein